MSKRRKELRKAKGMTLLELANKIGVSEGTVQRYESGSIPNLKYDIIVALSNALETTPTYLMGWDDIEKVDNEEKTFVESYRKLNEVHKQAINDLIKFYLQEEEKE